MNTMISGRVPELEIVTLEDAYLHLAAAMIERALRDAGSVNGHVEEARAWLLGTGISWAETIGVDRRIFSDYVKSICRERKAPAGDGEILLPGVGTVTIYRIFTAKSSRYL